MAEKNFKEGEDALERSSYERELKEEIERLVSENEELKRREEERIFSEDLKKVRELDPMVESIDDLGDAFIALRAGGIDAKDAYRAVLAISRKKEIPQMGDVLSKGEEKEFYSPGEVKHMSKGEIKKNYDKIRKSMASWKA